MLRLSGSAQTPDSSVLDELQLSNGLFRKSSEESITTFHLAGDKSIDKFIQVLNGNKTSNYCS